LFTEFFCPFEFFATEPLEETRPPLAIKSSSTIKNNQPTEGNQEQEKGNERKNDGAYKPPNSFGGQRLDYRRAEAEAEINHAIERIMQHNEVPGTTHRDKFRVSVNALRKLVKGRSSKIMQEIIAQRSEEIEKHHQKHQLLNPKHNVKGRNAPSIETVISLD
jgi:IMP dehydrogenase/GMP reductase